MTSFRHVAVCLEHRFYQVDDNVYTKLAFPYYYWADYLSYFDKVTIIARVQKVVDIDSDMILVNGDGVDVFPLPYYVGIKEFLVKLPSLMRRTYQAASQFDHFLLRSGNSTNILFIMLMVLRKPFLREYPGNIKQGVIGFAGNRLTIRILANFLDRFAKFQARFSKANSFVSKYCFDLYASDKPSFIFSSFKSSEISCIKTNYGIDSTFNIVSVGRLEGEKGHIKLLKAIKDISNIKLHIIGDGHQKATLEHYADKYNINVHFYGTVTNRTSLFSLMQNSDLFVIPSLTEGMPRALLEAMTIGLPCLGSKVGGIPEVLQNSDLYNAEDTNELSEQIVDIIEDRLRREAMGNRNKIFIESKFSDKALKDMKHRFWNKLYE